MAFPPHFLDELRARLPVSRVVGRKVRLVQRGQEHTGLCPFHNEKTPSFTVNDRKGFFTTVSDVERTETSYRFRWKRLICHF